MKVSKADASNYRTPDQLMRGEAVLAAATLLADEDRPHRRNLIKVADELYQYIKTGRKQ